MTLFEFLMVLVSIIIGLGIAETLTGVARVIRCRGSIEGYWIHSVVVVAIFTALLQQWWEAWQLRAAPEWTFLGLVMMLSGPVGLFLMAHLVLPEPIDGANLREYYHGAMRPIWWLAALTVGMATLFRPLIFGHEVFSADNAVSLVLIIGFVILATTKRRAFHVVLVPVFLILLLFDILNWTFVIGGD